jgi:hypothetical protein
LSDTDPFTRHVDVAQDQGQNALADAAAAEHHEAAGKGDVLH